MAAYGALITLTNLMEPIRHYQARHPVFSGHQLMQLESLEEKVLFLQNFMETYSSGRRSHEIEALEDQIEDVVYYAQYLIESRIADIIRARFRGVADAESDIDVGYDAGDHLIESQIASDIRALCITSWKSQSGDLFSQGLQKVIQVLDYLTQRDALKIAESTDSLKDKQPRDSTSVGFDKPPTADQFNDPYVTFGDTLDQMMGRLLSRNQVELQTIPITGMGGIGKTTLAQTVYHNPRTYCTTL